MAKKSVIEREKRRAHLVAKYAEKRALLIATIKNRHLDLEERWAAQEALQKLPRDSNPVRQRNRCGQTGRPRGVYSRFGLGRSTLREIAMEGEVPGLRKSSW